MAIQIIWSATNGGAAMTAPLNIGTVPVGTTSNVAQIFIRHTGLQAITVCKLFIQPYSGSGFNGIETPQDNFEELTGATFSPGLQINIDQANDFPASSWRDVSRSLGSSVQTAFDIGTIPAGSSPGVSFKTRFNPQTLSLPAEDTGRRLFDFKLSFLTTD